MNNVVSIRYQVLSIKDYALTGGKAKMASDKEFRKLREQLAELNRRFQEAGGQVDEEIEDRLGDFKDKWGKQSREATEMMKEKSRMMDEYVNENPWKSVGMAFGVGLLVGWIINNNREY